MQSIGGAVMGFVDKNRDDLSGNTLLVSDMIFTWDDDEELPLEEDDPDEPEDDGLEPPD